MSADAPPDFSGETAVIIASVLAGMKMLKDMAINAKPRPSIQYGEVVVVTVIDKAETPVIAVPNAMVLRRPKRCMIHGARGTINILTSTIGPDVAIAACRGEYPLTSCNEIVARNIAPDIAINAKVNVSAAALN